MFSLRSLTCACVLAVVASTSGVSAAQISQFTDIACTQAVTNGVIDVVNVGCSNVGTGSWLTACTGTSTTSTWGASEFSAAGCSGTSLVGTAVGGMSNTQCVALQGTTVVEYVKVDCSIASGAMQTAALSVFGVLASVGAASLAMML